MRFSLCILAASAALLASYVPSAMAQGGVVSDSHDGRGSFNVIIAPFPAPGGTARIINVPRPLDEPGVINIFRGADRLDQVDPGGNPVCESYLVIDNYGVGRYVYNLPGCEYGSGVPAGSRWRVR